MCSLRIAIETGSYKANNSVGTTWLTVLWDQEIANTWARNLYQGIAIPPTTDYSDPGLAMPAM